MHLYDNSTNEETRRNMLRVIHVKSFSRQFRSPTPVNSWCGQFRSPTPVDSWCGQFRPSLSCPWWHSSQFLTHRRWVTFVLPERTDRIVLLLLSTMKNYLKVNKCCKIFKIRVSSLEKNHGGSQRTLNQINFENIKPKSLLDSKKLGYKSKDLLIIQ